MKDENKVGYCQPPAHSRWQKGQSGNPKGRPKSRSEILDDAAAILSEPVAAQTSSGRRVQLEAIEAGYLALCRKGLKGHKTSLLEAIRIMLDLGIVAEKAKEDDQRRRRLIEDLRAKIGLPPRDDVHD